MTAPLGVVRWPVSRHVRGLVPSPKSRLPSPRVTGKTITRSSSTRSSRQQRLDQARGAVHLQLAAVLGLERPDGVPDVALQQLRGLPLDRVERARGDVLLA